MAASLAFLAADRSAGEAYAHGRQKRYATAQDLESEANDLSNYGGGYTGYGDEFLEYSGNAGSFADAIHKGKVYNITLKNSSNNDLVALLCPGLVADLQGLIADGPFADAAGGAGLSAKGNPRPLIYFNNFIRQFPTLVAGFKIATTNIAQFEQDMTIFKESPFKQHESKIINVSIYASEANPNTALITVPEPFFMDCQTQIQYPVLANTTVSLGLIFGASLNIAKALKAKAGAAQKTMTAAASNFTGARRLY